MRYRQRAVVVPVLDVGPWNIDDAYWVQSRRPAAERNQGYYRAPSNRAGIDLSDAVFAELGLRDNDFVEWRFVHKGYLVLPAKLSQPETARPWVERALAFGRSLPAKQKKR